MNEQSQTALLTDIRKEQGIIPITEAFAEIKGSPLAPNLHGYVLFKEVENGTDVTVEVMGLPEYKPAKNGSDPVGPHGFHIHEHGNCQVGNPEEPFKGHVGEHWNPTNDPHGHHAGDFPVLFSNDGYARMTFFTNRFYPQDILNRAVIIHLNPDDYRTQPAGNSGKMIACGEILGVRPRSSF